MNTENNKRYMTTEENILNATTGWHPPREWIRLLSVISAGPLESTGLHFTVIFRISIPCSPKWMLCRCRNCWIVLCREEPGI